VLVTRRMEPRFGSWASYLNGFRSIRSEAAITEAIDIPSLGMAGDKPPPYGGRSETLPSYFPQAR